MGRLLGFRTGDHVQILEHSILKGHSHGHGHLSNCIISISLHRI